MSAMYEVRMTLYVSGGGDAAESFTRVADAYAALEAVHESLLDASFGFSAHDDDEDYATAQVDVEITVEAEDEDEAFALATSSVRAAIQTAGGASPDWEDRPDDAVTVYRLAEESVGLVSLT